MVGWDTCNFIHYLLGGGGRGGPWGVEGGGGCRCERYVESRLFIISWVGNEKDVLYHRAHLVQLKLQAPA